MLQGTGYILMTERPPRVGVIHVCDGDRPNFIGDDVAFAFDRCSSQLQNILDGRGNIGESRTCPPPAGTLRVRFDFDIEAGFDVAINVRQ